MRKHSKKTYSNNVVAKNIEKKYLRRKLASNIEQYLPIEGDYDGLNDTAYIDSGSDYDAGNTEVIVDFFNSLNKEQRKLALQEMNDAFDEDLIEEIVEDGIDEFRAYDVLVDLSPDTIDDKRIWSKVKSKLKVMYYIPARDFQNCVCYCDKDLYDVEMKLYRNADKIFEYLKENNITSKDKISSYLQSAYGAEDFTADWWASSFKEALENE